MNKQIVVAAFIITGAGIVNSLSSNPPKPITRTVMGGYIFLLVLSFLDLAGGSVAKIASALSMLAVVYVLLNVFPWGLVLSTLKGKK